MFGFILSVKLGDVGTNDVLNLLDILMRVNVSCGCLSFVKKFGSRCVEKQCFEVSRSGFK